MITSTVETQDINLTAAAISKKDAAKLVIANGHSRQARLDASKLTYTLTQNPRAVPDEGSAYAGYETIATDHMILAP